jgi:hypothetical protein
MKISDDDFAKELVNELPRARIDALNSIASNGYGGTRDDRFSIEL